MNITPENVLSAEHASWLAHPVTVQLMKNLEIYEKHLVNKISQNAFSEDDSIIKRCAISLNTTRNIKAFTFSTEHFIAVSENKIK